MDPRGRPLLGALPALCCALLAAGCGGGHEAASPPNPRAPSTLKVASPAFTDGGTIPRAFTCDGAGRPPPLAWSGVPATARELVLAVEDPNAPGGTFVHWVVAGLPASSHGLRGPPPAGARQGQNGAGKDGWTPPCPPAGDAPHHYVFSLYALRRPSALKAGAKPDAVRAALAAGVLATGKTTGTYGRGG